MDYIPLFLYAFRWNIEVSYYEQKTFWSLCSYMVRSRKGIELLVNLINIAYCAMKLLPYQDAGFPVCAQRADKEGTIFCHFGEKEQKYDKIIGSYESLEMPCPAK